MNAVNEIERIVVIGGGQAAAQALMSLRQGGYKGALTLIGDEPALPYQRPPLSKAYMKGEFEEARLYLRPQEWYEQQDIELRLGQRATAIDRTAQKVSTDTGDSLSYDRLIIATGARPRALPIPGADLDQVCDLRTLADVDRIRPQMIAGRRLIIIGAGYIGLEAAAVARQLGLDVTVVEMADRVLARVTSSFMSAYYQKLHEEKDVNILTNDCVTAFQPEADGTIKAVLENDGALNADLALIGIGILPNQECAEEAGLECDNGIVVDRDGRSSDHKIYAIGDCAKRPLAHYESAMRLESVHNAIEQGKLAAASILGKPRPPEDCPWFWSDQYDVKLQIAGISAGHDEMIVRGDPETGGFAVFYLQKGKLIAVDAVNSPPEFLMSKKLIAAGAQPATDQLADPAVSMKDIAADFVGRR